MAGPSVGFATLQIIPSMRGAQAAMSSGIAGPASAVGAGAGRSMGGSMSKALGGALKVGLGGALVGAGIVTGLAKLGGSFDKAFDTIRVGTGATGDSLEELKGTFKDVFRAVPTDMSSAATAVADLNTRLGLTGGNLEATAKQMLELSRITETDLGSNIEAVSRVFGDWGITVDDQGERLDQLFRASQATGIGVDTLGQQMVKYGAPLRQLGFGFETTAGLLGKFEKEGVNAELVMGSMRIALGKMAREGIPAEEGLKQVVDGIANAGSASEANAMALELFGARAGPDMAAAIREGRFDLGELYDTIAFGQETVMGAAEDTQSFGEKWNIIKNRVLVGLEPLATRVFDALGIGMDWISEKAPVFAAWFSEHIWPTLSRAGEIIGGAVSDGFALLSDWWAENGETVTSGLKAIADSALGAISGWWDDHGDKVTGGIKAIGDFINDPVIPALQALFEIVRDDVLPKLQDLYEYIVDNEYILVGLAAVAGTVLVVAFGAWAVAAGGAAIATITAGIAAALAYLPIFLLAVGIGILAAGLWYAYTNWGWFRDGVNFAAAAMWGTILGISVVVGWLQTLVQWLKNAVTWAKNLASAMDDIVSPGGGAISGLFNAASGGILGKLDDLPIGDMGGVMPGPLGQHSLAWVAGGETVVPTHRSDFEPLVPAGRGDNLDGLVVVLDSGVVAGRIRRVDSYYHRRSGG